VIYLTRIFGIVWNGFRCQAVLHLLGQVSLNSSLVSVVHSSFKSLRNKMSGYKLIITHPHRGNQLCSIMYVRERFKMPFPFSYVHTTIWALLQSNVVLILVHECKSLQWEISYQTNMPYIKITSAVASPHEMFLNRLELK